MPDIPEWFVRQWANTALRVEGVYRRTFRKGARHRSGQRDMWSFRAVLRGVLRLRQGAWTADLEPGDQTLLRPDSSFTHEVLSDTCDLVAMDIRMENTGFGSAPLPTLNLPAVVRVPPSRDWLRSLNAALDAAGPGRQFDVFGGRGPADRVVGWYLKQGLMSGAIVISPRIHVPPWLAAARKSIETNFWRHDTDPGRMAGEAGFSRSYFNRVFRSVYGVTPMRHLWETRLQLAARKLDTDPSLAVGGIAYNCGFKSHTHFTRMFRQRFRMTPLAWRRRGRKTGDSPENGS